MTDSSRAVFLSYASQDAEAARRVCDALRAAGIEVWFDQSELRGGDAWDRQIRKQIHDCALFIPIISANSQARAEGYFRREWKLAVDRTHDMSDRIAFLVPVVIDDTRDSEADVPDAFRGVQWTRLPGGEAPPAFVTRISQLLSPSQPQAQVPPSTVSAPASRPTTPNATASRGRRLVALLIAAVALMAGGYIAFDKFVVSRRVAEPVVPAINPASPTQSAIPEKSIAVLPFVDMSEKHDQEYFSDGLSEELIDHLADAADLKVIARTSSFQFKGKNEDVRSIADKLGVAQLLEGSVRRSGNSLRITAQLIRASDGSHLWSHSYDRSVGDIFKVQDEIADTVARSLKVALNADTALDEEKHANTEAYNFVLKAKFYRQRHDKEDAARAVELCKEAIRLEPNYAYAWALLAATFMDEAFSGWMPRAAAMMGARSALERAAAGGSRLVFTHFELARAAAFDWNWSTAQLEIERMRAIEPNNLNFLAFAEAEMARILGRSEEAIAIYYRISDRDPLNWRTLGSLGYALQTTGKLKNSEAVFRKLLELYPTDDNNRSGLAMTLLELGRTPEALAVVEQETDPLGKLEALPIIYWALGRHDDSDAALTKLTTEYANIDATGIAYAHAFRGERDDAFEWLERAYHRHEVRMDLIKGEPVSRNLHGDPRYKALLRKMNLPE